MSDRWFRYSSFVTFSSRAVNVCAICTLAERVRRVEAAKLVSIRRRLGGEHAILRGDERDVASRLEGVALIPQSAAKAKRRYSRQRLVVVLQRPSHVVETELHGDLWRHLDIRVCLDAIQNTVGGNVLDDRKFGFTV